MKPEIQAILDKHNLTVESVFVPWSQSRNAGKKNPSLNWKVTLLKEGRKILSTDYSAGMGHCPSYKGIRNPMQLTIADMDLIMFECEKGKIAGRYFSSLSSVMPPIDQKKRGNISPDSHDVIYSLLIDSDVLEHSDFESWASDFGYDADSRQAEKTYQACMKIALQFRQIGESVISELREVYQDY